MPKDYRPGMGFYATESYLLESDPLPENRVGGFRASPIIHARRFPAQVVEPHQEVVTFDSSTVSGVGEWLSNDPIGISGGLNQYVFCGNNPVNFTDPYGLYKYTTSNLGLAFLNEINPFNSDGGFASQAISIGDAMGGTAAHIGGYHSGAQEILNEAVNMSGQAVLDDTCAGKGAKAVYWGAIGISAAADITAAGLMAAGVDPWMGKIAYHAAHAGGPHQFPHLQFMLRTGQSITQHFRIPLPW